MNKHENNGACLRCLEIFARFPHFNSDLFNWFLMIQAKFPDFHISEAGRGKIQQEQDFNEGESHAHWGESAHNYNCAFDSFFLINGKYTLEKILYDKISPEIPDFVNWYGMPTAVFYERPHFEKADWRELLKAGLVKLVE